MTVAQPTRVRFTTQQAAEYASCHEDTIRRAAEAGELHGAQRTKPNGRWSFHIDCLEAWLHGADCPHKDGA